MSAIHATHDAIHDATQQKSRYEQPIPYGWYCVAYSNELPPGEVRPLKYFGEDLVLFRTEGGEAKVLEAYCPHLGAHLGHGGTVHAGSIACPFHGWQFDGAGMLTSVPYAKKTPPRVAGKQCLHSYPIKESRQLIWVWYHPERIAPLWEVDEVEELAGDNWTDYDCYEWQVKSVIQEMGENAVDTAHFVYVHGTPEIPVGEIIVEQHRRSTDVAIKVTDLDNPTPKGEAPNIVDGRLFTRSVGPGQTVQVFDTFFKTVMLGSVTPIDRETVHLRFTFTQPIGQTEMQKNIGEMAIAEIVRQVKQDIPIWEHKKYRANPVLCDGDGPINKYRQWFQQFYVPESAADQAPIRSTSTG